MATHVLVADFSRSLLGFAASPPPLDKDTVSLETQQQRRELFTGLNYNQRRDLLLSLDRHELREFYLGLDTQQRQSLYLNDVMNLSSV